MRECARKWSRNPKRKLGGSGQEHQYRPLLPLKGVHKKAVVSQGPGTWCPQFGHGNAKERRDPAVTGSRKGRLCVCKEDCSQDPCVRNPVDLLPILLENVSKPGTRCLHSKTLSVSPITQSLLVVFLPFSPLLWPLLGLLLPPPPPAHGPSSSVSVFQVTSLMSSSLTWRSGILCVAVLGPRSCAQGVSFSITQHTHRRCAPKQGPLAP